MKNDIAERISGRMKVNFFFEELKVVKVEEEILSYEARNLLSMKLQSFVISFIVYLSYHFTISERILKIHSVFENVFNALKNECTVKKSLKKSRIKKSRKKSKIKFKK